MMTAMSPSPTPPTGPAEPTGHVVHVLRPRSSAFLGGCAIVVCVGLAVLGGGGSGLVFTSAMILAAAASFVLLVRPNVRVSIEGVAVHNPCRQTFVPWRLLEDVGSRWNLELYAADRTVSAWAISSHIERPRGGSFMGFGGIGAAQQTPQTAGREAQGSRSSTRPAVTAPRAARLIEASREEWLEAVAEGAVIEPAHPQIVRQWDLIDIALLAVPTALLAVGLLT